ncbi:hypothetical protein B0J11DRAFT_562498 [Dendryphion nanum]|uniref:Uncharacterized protein n=1 Tax=Dendryphion nanum TaxID=256645 RepID=A0A9P9IA50_9PLEO|nr:hypothetical protein B0J11DRAFT_562498 [Dendryphion nanum]
MAVDLKKRKRGPVSYKEPSSDEDFSSDSNDTRSSRRKRIGAPPRRSVRHQTSNTADTTDTQPAPTVQPIRTKAASSRSLGHKSHLRGRGRRRVFYGEDSSSDGLDASEYEASEQIKVDTDAGRGSSLKKIKSSPKKSKNSLRRLGRLGAPLKHPDPSHKIAESSRSIISDGRIPPWATLPYHVLLQIFVYAAHPLHDENLSPTPSIAWLARTARICSTFTKPALTALYRNPPIFALRQNRKKLVQHLISPPSGAHGDYGVMVKRLELDATKMSQLTDAANSLTDLVALIPSLRTLREIDIFDPYDKPPYRERMKQIRRWYYPDELFEALERSNLRLKAWRWSNTYCLKGYLWMKDIHSRDSFQSLRELSLTKYHTRPKPKPETDSDEVIPTVEELLATALTALPNLNALTFETCSIVNGGLLPLLPKNLKSLNITNCRELTSEPFQAFLATHGNRLEELVLNHNQSLDLAFLVNLKETCPRLEVLRMDMHYYSSLLFSSDNEPLYDELLSEGEIPTWPSTLQVIDLEFLRNWSPRAAIAFFTSLIESAGELPSLQEITVTAMVDVDWRQRAEFRKNWTARFQKVFARKTLPPNRNLVSLRAFREAALSAGSPPIDVDEKAPRDSDGNDESKQETSDSDVPLRGRDERGDVWDTKRLRSRAIAKYDSPSMGESGSDEDSNEGLNKGSDDDHGVDIIQGLCHTVIFRIDNSRPQEQIYDEQDFLDDEISGDEDWDGNNDVVDDGGYAW